MASISKIIGRTTVQSQTKTKLSTLLPVTNKLGIRQCNYSGEFTPTTYDVRKLGHNLSTDNNYPCFEILKNIPSGVFRDTSGEVLGLGAGKCNTYKNPEYFSFHHMSYYDLNIGLRQYRLPCPKTGRKPI